MSYAVAFWLLAAWHVTLMIYRWRVSRVTRSSPICSSCPLARTSQGFSPELIRVEVEKARQSLPVFPLTTSESSP